MLAVFTTGSTVQTPHQAYMNQLHIFASYKEISVLPSLVRISSGSKNQIRIVSHNRGCNRSERKKASFQSYYDNLPQKPPFPGYSWAPKDLPVADSDDISSRDIHLKLYGRKTVAVEIIHWWKKRTHMQTPARAFALHSLFTQKISVQIWKKQQTWQESVLPLRRFPAQNMLSSNLWS